VLLTLTSAAPSATDRGYLLHKHPDRVQSFDLSVGTAHVNYPGADADRCTVALLLESIRSGWSATSGSAGMPSRRPSTSMIGRERLRLCWPSPSAESSGRR
jgi:hypothetical protein